MTSWHPLGTLPPLTTEEWEVEFQRYQTFPEYQQRQSMDLSEFKYIYFWEYAHRMMGRTIGLAFCLPWAYLTVRNRIPSGYQPRLALLCGFGGLQGVVGWWMVQSGLGEDRRGDSHQIRVQPTRLATHLGLAMFTYSGLVWTALDIFKLPHFQNKAAEMPPRILEVAKSLRWGGAALAGLTFTTILSGALVAGNDAGRAYNTFPKMNDQWIPEEYDPKNFTHNTATTQWNHRVLGTTTAATALAMSAVGLRRPQLLTPQTRKALVGIGVATSAQFGLGLVTLLNYVPIGLAALHQLGSVLVLTTSLYLVHSVRYVTRPALRKVAQSVP